MKKSKIFRITCIILQIIYIINMFASSVYASTSGGMYGIYDRILNNPFDSSVSTIVGILQAVGMVIAIIMLTIIGIKYIMVSPEGKADLKQQLFPYFIGCILLFGGSVLIGVIANYAYSNIK